jgi:hypothetical protein
MLRSTTMKRRLIEQREAYSLEGIGLNIGATDEGCECLGAGLDRLAPFWSSLCFFDPLEASASSRERLADGVVDAGCGAVSLAFVKLRPSLFQAGTLCSVDMIVDAISRKEQNQLMQFRGKSRTDAIPRKEQNQLMQS